MTSPMCDHGEWTWSASSTSSSDHDSGACVCEEYWHGDDCSIRSCQEGVLNSTTSRCHCQPGYGGEYCHLPTCLHEGEWYCDIESEYDRRPCPDEAMRGWTPLAIDEDSWNCACGFGRRTWPPDNNTIYSVCECQEGYYGKFCHLKSCEHGTIWDAWNRTCVEENDEIQITIEEQDERAETSGDGEKGMFGFDLSSELLLASLLMAVFLIALLVIIRLCVRKFNCNNGRSSSIDYLERIAIDEIRARRSGRLPFVRNGGVDLEKGTNGGGRYRPKKMGGAARKEIGGGRFNNGTWRNGADPQALSILGGNQGGPAALAFHRLTTVMEEENSEEEEDEETSA